jgi:uncharacterized protein YecT (DUF1311 family)
MRRLLTGCVGISAIVLLSSLTACGPKTSAPAKASVDTTLSTSSAPPPAPSSAPAPASSSADATASNAPADPNEALYSADYKTCMATGDAAQGVTSAMLDCTNAEADRQDQKLNATYKRVMAAATDDDERVQLRDAERKWIKARDATCTSEAADDGGGSLSTVTYASCQLKQRIDRNKQLENQ